MHALLLILSVGTFFTGSFENASGSFPNIEGWQRSSAVLTFTGDNLWEHINGAADQFLDYEFIELQTCELTRNEMTISVEIYQMQTPLHAFGIYTAERPHQTERLSIGGEAVVLPPGQILLMKDIYYIKIFAYEGEFSEESGLQILQKIAAVIPGVEGLPPQLKLLPEKFKITGSEGFISSSYLGIKDLSDCVFAHYQDSLNTRFQFFFMVGTEINFWNQLQQQNWKTIQVAGTPYLYRNIPYKGDIGLFIDRQSIAGIAYFENIEDIFELRSRFRAN